MGHALDTIYHSSFRRPLLVSLRFYLSRCSSYLYYLTPRPSLLIFRTQALCYDVERASTVIRKSTRRLLHASEALWLSYFVSVGLGIPRPDLLDPRASIFLSLPEMLSNPSNFGRNLFCQGLLHRTHVLYEPQDGSHEVLPLRLEQHR